MRPIAPGRGTVKNTRHEVCICPPVVHPDSILKIHDNLKVWREHRARVLSPRCMYYRDLTHHTECEILQRVSNNSDFQQDEFPVHTEVSWNLHHHQKWLIRTCRTAPGWEKKSYKN